MRDLDWIKTDNEKALARVKDGGPLYQEDMRQFDAMTVVHDRMKKEARQINTLWKCIVITQDGTVRPGSGKVYAQDDVFRMHPEISPRFFENFGVVELTIRQGNGNQIKLMKVR